MNIIKNCIEIIFKSLIVVIILICVLVFFGSIINFYCDNFGDKYFQDSSCFDIDFRCQIECISYNETFSGIIERGCMCQCEYGEVSYCSGAYYNYDGTMPPGVMMPCDYYNITCESHPAICCD